MDFFSPVSPNNHLRQSYPFSYVTITVSGSSDVRVLSAIDDSWYGQPDNVVTNGSPYGGPGIPISMNPSNAKRGSNPDSNLVSHYQNKGATSMISLTDPNATDYKEINNMAAWGSIVLATSQAGSSSVSYQSGLADTVFSRFVESGSLNGTLPTYTKGNCIAFAQKIQRSMASTTSTPSVTFAVGQYRDNVVNYLGNDQVAFFKSAYSNVLDTVDGFLNDYESAFSESQSFDKAVFNETSSISSNYTDLTTVVVRQRLAVLQSKLGGLLTFHQLWCHGNDTSRQQYCEHKQPIRLLEGNINQRRHKYS